MKTTIKLGMLTAAFLLAFASCSNIVKDPVAATDDVAKSVIDDGLTNGRNFKVTAVKGDKYGDIENAKNVHYQVKITFSHRPDANTLNGVTFRSLQNATNVWSMPQTKQTYTPAKTEVVNDDVYFTFDFNPADVTDFYVFIDANTVKAENGAMLNHDDDCKWGEGGVGGDDSYAWLLHPKSGSTSLSVEGVTGNANYDQELGTPTNLVWTWGGAFTLKGGNGADKCKIAKATVTMTGESSIDDAGTVNGLLGPLVQKHVKVQHYNWKKGEWEDVTATFTLKAMGTYEADISIPDGHYARFKFIDQDELKGKSYKTKLRGYSIRFATLGECYKINSIVTAVSSVYSNEGVLATDSAFYSLTATPSDGKVSIKFSSATLPVSNVYMNNAWHTVSTSNATQVTKPGVDIKTLFKGFDVSTVKPENFKCYDDKDKLMPIKSVTAVKSNVPELPEAFNEIVILLEDSKKAPSKVYISPEVKTSGFKGSDDSSPAKAYDIPALSFADNKPNYTSPEEKGLGWRKL